MLWNMHILFYLKYMWNMHTLFQLIWNQCQTPYGPKNEYPSIHFKLMWNVMIIELKHHPYDMDYWIIW
jgi:hypothetical protein